MSGGLLPRLGGAARWRADRSSRAWTTPAAASGWRTRRARARVRVSPRVAAYGARAERARPRARAHGQCATRSCRDTVPERHAAPGALQRQRWQRGARARRRATLLVDAGLPREEMGARLENARLGRQEIDDVLVTHGHLDHARSAGDRAGARAATVHCREPDAPALGRARKRFATLTLERENALGDVLVTPLRIPHDADPTLAFRIEHAGRVAAIVTDMGRPDRRWPGACSGSTCWCSSSTTTRRCSQPAPTRRAKRRILGNAGHLSNAQAALLLRQAAGAACTRSCSRTSPRSTTRRERALDARPRSPGDARHGPRAGPRRAPGRDRPEPRGLGRRRRSAAGSWSQFSLPRDPRIAISDLIRSFARAPAARPRPRHRPARRVSRSGVPSCGGIAAAPDAHDPCTSGGQRGEIARPPPGPRRSRSESYTRGRRRRAARGGSRRSQSSLAR